MKICIESGAMPQLPGRSANVGVIVIEEDSIQFHGKRHTVLVLDCSQSMAYSIDRVRCESMEYVGELRENEFVSVIIFSGHDTAKLIAGPTQCTKDGKIMVRRTIEKEVRLIGTTLFSEPLELTLATVKRLAGDDTVHNAVLFTDGCAVPERWNVETEQGKALAVARQLNDFGAVVSVIGYGVHYDAKFLASLMEAAGNNGIYRHISDITNFREAVETIRRVFDETMPVNLEITFSPNQGTIHAIFRTTPEVSMAIGASGFNARGLLGGKVTLFAELSGQTDEITVEGTVNGKQFKETVKARPLSPERAPDYVRVLGALAFLRGDRNTAEAMLRLSGDAFLADRAATSYTDREKRETADVLRRFYRDREFIGAGLKPTGPSHCVLNVLRTLIEDKESVVYIPTGAYARSGELTSDPRVMHSPLGKVLKVMGYASHESRFNFSLRTLKDVKVKPEDGGAPVDAKIWRTYNVILDGNLHLPELQASLSERSFTLLKDAGVIEEKAIWAAGKAYTLNLKDLRLVSNVWANPATLGLVPLLLEEAELESEQKALNARLTTLGVEKPEFEGVIYHPKSEKIEEIPVETYEAPCVEIRLMGYKPQIQYASEMTAEAAQERVKKVRHRLIVVRYLIRSMTFAMEIVGSRAIAWDLGVTTQRGKYPKLEQRADLDGAKLKRVTWIEEAVCS